jgi:hypothetical protein
VSEQTPLSEEELAAIEARALAATDGPWAARFDGERQGIFVAHAGVVLFDVGHVRPAEPDAEFIACARTDVPRLLMEVHRLRAQIAKLEANSRY